MVGYTASFGVGADDPYLIELGTAPEPRWTRILPGEGVNRTITGARATDGGYFLVGFTFLPAKREGGALLIKVKADGQPEWKEHLFYGSVGDSLAYTVVGTADGGCIVTGHTTTRGAGKMDAFLHKVDPE